MYSNNEEQYHSDMAVQSIVRQTICIPTSAIILCYTLILCVWFLNCRYITLTRYNINYYSCLKNHYCQKAYFRKHILSFNCSLHAIITTINYYIRKFTAVYFMKAGLFYFNNSIHIYLYSIFIFLTLFLSDPNFLRSERTHIHTVGW